MDNNNKKQQYYVLQFAFPDENEHFFPFTSWPFVDFFFLL